MTIRKILAYVFAIIALIFEGFFGIEPFLGFVVQVVLISCAFYFLLYIFRRKNMPAWRTTIVQYILTILATIGFFTTSFLVFIAYQHQVPGILSDITLSNSGQEVVFIQMSHIATPEFFIEKQNTIKALSNSGYVIVFEGVKPGTPENQMIFNQSVGFNFTPTLYTSIAEVIGLRSQDNAVLYSGIATGSLVSTDLSIDEIVTLMGTGGITTATGSLKNIEDDIQSSISLLSSRERMFIGWIARGILNWSLKQSDDIDILLRSGDNSQLFETIIDRRNDKIVEYIVAHPKQKIVVVYGALHFNGVYESLQKIDKNWKTIEIKNSTPYTR